MGKIQITCNFNDNNEMTFEVENISENECANALREIFLTAIQDNLVRKSILLQVLNDILKAM